LVFLLFLALAVYFTARVSLQPWSLSLPSHPSSDTAPF
jgi:hypothetical protein